VPCCRHVVVTGCGRTSRSTHPVGWEATRTRSARSTRAAVASRFRLAPAAGRAEVEEPLEPVRHGFLVVRPELRVSPRRRIGTSSTPGGGAGEAGQIGGLDELGLRTVLPERLQAGVAQVEHVWPARRELEPVRKRPHRDHERVERMQEATVAPVEEEVSTIAHEHVPVVQVVVLERLRNAEGGESGARVGVLGKECLQPPRS
jgi:hypothetical protein